MPDNKDRRGKLYDALKDSSPEFVDGLSRDAFISGFSDTAKVHKLYDALKQSSPEFVDGVDPEAFKSGFGDIPDNKKQNSGHTAKIGNQEWNSDNFKKLGTTKGDKREIFQTDTGHGVIANKDGTYEYYNNQEYDATTQATAPAAKKKEDYSPKAKIAPSEVVPISATVPSATAQADASYDHNVDETHYGEVDGQKFNSDAAQKVGDSKLYGDILSVTFENGVKGLVHRNPGEGGTYSWYTDGKAIADKSHESNIRYAGVDDKNWSDQYKQFKDTYKTDDIEAANKEIDRINQSGNSEMARMDDMHSFATPRVSTREKIDPNSEFAVKVKNKKSNDYWSKMLPELQAQLESAPADQRANIQDQITKAEAEIKRTEQDVIDLTMDKKEVERATALAFDKTAAADRATKNFEQSDKNILTDQERVNAGLEKSKSEHLEAAKNFSWGDIMTGGGQVINHLYGWYNGYERTNKGDINNDVLVNKYTVQLSATADENNKLSVASKNKENTLKNKYGGKWDEYVSAMSEEAPAILKDFEAAKQKGDNALAAAKAKKYQDMIAKFDDIKSDEDYQVYTAMYDKIRLNTDYLKELEASTGYANAKAIVESAKAARDFQEKRYRESEKQWNSGERGTAMWNQGGMYTEQVPRLVVNAIDKIPMGVIDVMDAFSSSLDSDGKADYLIGVKNWAHGKFNDEKMINPIAAGIEGSTGYQVMSTMADLIPQGALASMTGFVGNAIGLGAKTTQILGGIMANVGIAYHDQYEANLSMMPDDMSDDDKRRYASVLALSQTIGVGVAGEFIGGSLGMITKNKGFLDDYLELGIFSTFGSKEFKDILRREAPLLAEGRVKDYLTNTTDSFFDKMKNMYLLAAAGTKAATFNGLKETLEENVTEPLSQKVFEFGYQMAGGKGDFSKNDHEADNTQFDGDAFKSLMVPFAMGMLVKTGGMVTESAKATYHNALETALKHPESFMDNLNKYDAMMQEKLKGSPEELKQFQKVRDKIKNDFDMIHGKFGVLSEQVDEHRHPQLIDLLRKKADIENKLVALKPTAETIAADRAYNNAREKGEDGKPIGEEKNGLAEYSRKQVENAAVDKQIDELTKNKKIGLVGLAGSWIDKFKEKRGKSNSAEQAKNLVDNAKKKLADGSLGIEDLAGTSFFNNLSDDRKNEIQAALDNESTKGETQSMILKEIEKDVKLKSADNLRVVADRSSVSDEDLAHNINLRTEGDNGVTAKDDNNNIAFNKKSSYSYASKDQADSVKETGSAKGLKFNKGSSKGEKGNYVIEQTKDKDGNTVSRVFEKQTDGSYSVVHDEIGTKAMLNNNDLKRLKGARYSTAQIAADKKRDEIIQSVNGNAMVDGKRVYDPILTEKALAENKEYQALMKKANTYSPNSSIFGDVISSLKGNSEKVSKQKMDEAKEKMITEKMNKMLKNKEIVKEDCE